MNENEKESEIIVIYLDDKQERERSFGSNETSISTQMDKCEYIR